MGKRGQPLTALCLIATLVAVNVGTAYAEVKSTGDISILDKTTFCGTTIHTSFQDKQMVIPGQMVSDIVTAQNTGNIDEVIRLKVNRKCGDKSDVVGNLIENTKSLQNVYLDWDRDNWVYKDDGYYYYKKVLRAGENSSPFMKQFKVSEDTDKSYENKKASLDFVAEAIQAGGQGTTLWGKDIKKDLGIDYTSSSSERVTQITLEKDNYFKIEQKINAFDYNKILPNETVTQSIKLQNNSDNHTVDFYVYNKTQSKKDLTGQQKDRLKNLLEDKISVTINNVDGKIVYQGPVLSKGIDITDKKSFTSPSYKVATLSNKDEERAFSISVHKDASLTNESNALIGDTIWYISTTPQNGSGNLSSDNSCAGGTSNNTTSSTVPSKGNSSTVSSDNPSTADNRNDRSSSHSTVSGDSIMSGSSAAPYSQALNKKEKNNDVNKGKDASQTQLANGVNYQKNESSGTNGSVQTGINDVDVLHGINPALHIFISAAFVLISFFCLRRKKVKES